MAHAITCEIVAEEYSYDLRAADMNGDGHLDLWFEGGRIALGNGNGFDPPVSVLPNAPGYVQDLDGDGDIDMLSQVYEYEADGVGYYSVRWRENLGGGTWGPTQRDNTPLRYIIAFLDVHADGALDFVDSGLQVHENTGSRWRSGDQLCPDPLSYYCRYVAANAFVADLDGDGDDDIVVSHGNTAFGLVVYEQRASGSLRELQTLSTSITGRVATGDITGDGRVDIVALHEYPDWGLHVYRQRPTGVFSEPQRLVGPPASHVLIEDVNLDGAADVLTYNSSSLTLWINHGGTLAPPRSINLALSDLQLVDVDHRGNLDLLTTSSPDDRTMWCTLP